MRNLNQGLNINRYNRIINYIVVFIILIIIYFSIFNKSVHEINYEDELNSEYKGVVTKKFIDFSDHAICKLILDTKLIIPVWDNCYERVNIGDSIVKKKGNFKFIIYKKNEILVINIDDNLIIPDSAELHSVPTE